MDLKDIPDEVLSELFWRMVRDRVDAVRVNKPDDDGALYSKGCTQDFD